MKSLLWFILLSLFVSSGLAQDRFEHALTLPKRTENLVFRDRVKPNWLPDGKSFWYRIQTSPAQHEFVLINAATGERKTAPSLKALGLPEKEALKSSTAKIELHKTSRTGEESGLKFINQLDTDVDLFWINQQGEHTSYGRIRAGSEREQHTYEGHVWLITSSTGEHLAAIEASATPQTLIIDGKGLSRAKDNPQKKTGGTPSPDGKWSAIIEQEFVLLHDLTANKTLRLKIESAAKSPLHGPIRWSPDSKTFVVSSCVPVPVRKLTLVDSTPKDQLQPKLIERDYAKPGDPLPKPFPVIFRITDSGCEWTRVKSDLFPNPFTQSEKLDLHWSSDSSEFYFEYNQRGHQLYRILAVNAQTADVRVVVEETSKTFVDYTHKTWRHWLGKTGELLWMSERDGWCHIYLYDTKTGRVKNQITTGTWPAREVLHVDETKREIQFLASGLRKDEDPYHLHLCRINFNGTGFLHLTQGDGNHHIEFSPNRDYFTDSYSRADLPPVHELRRSSDGTLVCELEKTDATQLLAAGWTLPERFVAKGRDGTTDIHGILIKPSHFDPAKKYPVIEDIYAGPHSAFTPKDFGRLLTHHILAELGFIIVKLDGMGTNHRGKAFHDVCWKNLKDAGFPDRIAWIKAAAKTRPWMDLSRVGIYGGSAGGQNAMRALLDHHSFYHVAVADCGCHDNRMDKIWWNEQWMGWPVDDSYAHSSNKEDAHKLKGHLLLIVGELDTNVDPATTTQVVGALQKAGKTFDFMPIIGTGHGAAETPYGSRMRMEFLVRHLRP
ncbi:prolyl oligopeptidase family serine peptidase [Prosthecobacter sp.]|uniref:prolyl oligopeptidase family serine peptidase n=1 Tax=Prosthecobacter sp. TaxID=1965333 RepID=UPI00248955E8|nr:prolyl oligopeptidase family serine peptidase [Prosthecobacter sp.]MDI1314728.1 prolyl oligopeptidase family serine peptidase [Prosthecobacter sp.]